MWSRHFLYPHASSYLWSLAVCLLKNLRPDRRVLECRAAGGGRECKREKVNGEREIAGRNWRKEFERRCFLYTCGSSSFQSLAVTCL